MRPRKGTTVVRPEPILGEHPVRNALIIGLASAALLSCILTAAFLDPPESEPDPVALKKAADAKQAQALLKLTATLRVAIEFWFDKNLKDPDSLEVIQWSTPSETADGNWLLAVKYRARNSFGGMAVESRVFTLDKAANVLDSQTLPSPDE